MRWIVFLLLLLAPLVAAAAPPPASPFLAIDPGLHTGTIRAIDASADGSLIATASEDKTVRLWSVTEKRLLRTFRLPQSAGEGGRAYAVALSPDGRILAAGGLDADHEINRQGGYVYLFDTISGRIISRLGPVADAVYILDFSGDGKQLAAGLANGAGILLWEAPFTGTALQDQTIGGSLTDLAFDPAGTLYAAAEDGMLRIYGKDLQSLARMALPGGGIAGSLSISPGGTLLAIGYKDRAAIDIVSLSQQRIVHSVDTGFVTRGNLAKVAWSGDGRTLYATGTFFINDPDPFLIFALPDEGRGAPELVGDTMGSVMDMVTLPGAGAAFASALPEVGLLGNENTRLGPANANMTEKLGREFQLAADGQSVWFGLDVGAKDPWLFDAANLTFKSLASPPQDFSGPDTASLPLQNWEDTDQPTLGGVPLPLRPGDQSHAAAIVPGARGVIVGSGWGLTRFDTAGGILWRARTYGTCWGVNVSADGKLVIAAYDDGTLRWYRSENGQELLSFYVHVPTKRWIAWTPSGYYSAAPGAEDLIGWHVNGKSWTDAPVYYPASRFRDHFYRPDVVALALAVRDEAKAVAEADQLAARKAEPAVVEDMLPATVEILAATREIETSTPEIAITYRLSSPAGREITRVELRIDDRPAATRGVAQDETAYPVDEELSLQVKLPKRDSVLSLIAYIGDQPGPSASVQVRWRGPGDETARHDLHALLIGVSQYQNEAMRLGYAAKDAQDLAAKLQNQAGTFYNAVNVEVLADAQATKSAVEKQLTLLKKRARPDDTVLVFLAGHGMTSAAFDFYFLATDSDMDQDLLEATAVDGRLIRKILGSLPGRVVLMMDTCRSGAGIEGAVDMSRAANDMAQENAGIVMFASAQGREDSLETAEWQNGAFTEALLSILDDPQIYGGDGRLSIPELEEAVTVRVSELTNGRQNAGMTKYGASPRFFIAGLGPKP